MPDTEGSAAAGGTRRPAGLPARLAALVLAGLLVYFGWTCLQVAWLRTHAPRTTAFMRDGLERLRVRDPGARLDYRWVPYERISESLKRAVIAAEDARFLDHDGFDVEAIGEAIETNARSRRIRHGGSTISQQLAKNLFLSPRRTLWRKADEAVITMILERVLDKRRILEIYLNVIEWGDGVYGAEAAAHHYYGVAAADLDPAQAARLAALIPNPRRYARDPESDYLDQRTDFLLGQMAYARIP